MCSKPCNAGSNEHPEKMRQRRETVEHPFGTIKARMGATHFLMKTLPRVAAEMALHVLAYNMTRVINIMGDPFWGHCEADPRQQASGSHCSPGSSSVLTRPRPEADVRGSNCSQNDEGEHSKTREESSHQPKHEAPGHIHRCLSVRSGT